MVIDSHQHFWNYNSKKHSWIDDDMAVIRKDFTPEDLAEVFAENKVDGCIAVQVDQTVEETKFLSDLAAKNSFIKGVVGWEDLRAENIEEKLQAWKLDEKIVGFRHIVQGEADHNYVLRPEFQRGIEALTKLRYTYDILIYPHQLPATLELIARNPNQKFVIDHIAKPYIKDGFITGWASAMNNIGRYKNVYCKLSGMITEADYKTWTAEQIMPYIDTIFDSFGSDRVMFGSDWPVCLVAGQYKEVKELVSRTLSGFSLSKQSNIMGANALEFYNIY